MLDGLGQVVLGFCDFLVGVCVLMQCLRCDLCLILVYFLTWFFDLIFEFFDLFWLFVMIVGTVASVVIVSVITVVVLHGGYYRGMEDINIREQVDSAVQQVDFAKEIASYLQNQNTFGNEVTEKARRLVYLVKDNSTVPAIDTELLSWASSGATGTITVEAYRFNTSEKVLVGGLIVSNTTLSSGNLGIYTPATRLFLTSTAEARHYPIEFVVTEGQSIYAVYESGAGSVVVSGWGYTVPPGF